MPRFGVFLVTACLLLGTHGSVAAQDQPRHEGFWIGAGLGYGSWDRACNGCGSLHREGSLSGYLNFGLSLSPRFLLGLEGDGWAKSIGPFDDFVGNVAIILSFYPGPGRGFFLKGGGGLSYFRASGPAGVEHAVGPGFLAGLGYELPVAKRLALVPAAAFLYGALGNNTRNGSTLNTGVTQNLIQLTLGLVLD